MSSHTIGVRRGREARGQWSRASLVSSKITLPAESADFGRVGRWSCVVEITQSAPSLLRDVAREIEGVAMSTRPGEYLLRAASGEIARAFCTGGELHHNARRQRDRARLELLGTGMPGPVLLAILLRLNNGEV